MRSFTLFAFASLGFGLFCSAAPTPVALGIEANVEASVEVKRDATVPAEDTICLESTLTGLVSEITPIVEKISSLAEVELTVDVLIPELELVKEIISTATVTVGELAELNIEDLLKSVTGGDLLDVKAVAKLIAAVIRVVLNLLQCVLGLVTGSVKEAVLPLLHEIIELLVKLLSLVLNLVSKILFGVVKAVLELISDLIPCIIENDLKSLIGLLGIVH